MPKKIAKLVQSNIAQLANSLTARAWMDTTHDGDDDVKYDCIVISVIILKAACVSESQKSLRISHAWQPSIAHVCNILSLLNVETVIIGDRSTKNLLQTLAHF